jgi:hypothetical protein
MTGVMAMAMLGVAELVIIAVLIVLPILTEGTVEVWQIVLCAILLLTVSTVFVVRSFVKVDGKSRWRWATR